MGFKYKIIIKNIDWNVTKNDLNILLKNYGDIVNLNYNNKNKYSRSNYCIITYNNYNDYCKLLQQDLIINNRKLIIEEFNQGNDVKKDNDIIKKWQKLIELDVNKNKNIKNISDSITWQQKESFIDILNDNNNNNNNKDKIIKTLKLINIKLLEENNLLKETLDRNRGL